MGYHDHSRENENTLFLTLQLSNLLLSLSFSTRKDVSMASLLSFFLISLKKNEFKTTHNTFQDCRLHFSKHPLYLSRAVKLYNYGYINRFCGHPLIIDKFKEGWHALFAEIIKKRISG